jgi:hypothetical protein
MLAPGIVWGVVNLRKFPLPGMLAVVAAPI